MLISLSKPFSLHTFFPPSVVTYLSRCWYWRRSPCPFRYRSIEWVKRFSGEQGLTKTKVWCTKGAHSGREWMWLLNIDRHKCLMCSSIMGHHSSFLPLNEVCWGWSLPVPVPCIYMVLHIPHWRLKCPTRGVLFAMIIRKL